MLFLQTCHQNRQTVRVREEISPIVELKHVKLRGKIRVVTDYNSTNYFIYKGKPMGFQYELLKELADHLNVKLELTVNNNLTDAFDALEKGKCDLLAMNLAITKERAKRFTFTVPYSQTRQVLVQRKTNRADLTSDLNGEPLLIRNQLDLAGKTIYVQEGSAFEERLHSLSNEIGDTINIVNNGSYEVEQFISLVAKGDIDYTIAEENVALVNQTYYPNLDVETAISFPQNLGWALRKGSKNLKEDIDKWITEFKKSSKFKKIYRKYFRNNRSVRIVNSEYFSIKSGKISRFDPIIKRKANMIGMDWRLLASLIYQESRFDPKAESWVGAFGLMQLMPETAYLYDVDTLSTPEQNVEAGVKYIEYLNKRLDKTLKDQAADKLQFILASYNVGLGHILDARRLAEKNGKDPNKWAGNVDYYLLNKSKPEFYNDPVVRYGYCRGEEPFNYVNDILERYKHYQNILTN
jgi:membrane-bound lytic murein transglycosylase F